MGWPEPPMPEPVLWPFGPPPPPPPLPAGTAPPQEPYPVSYDVAYPARLSRWKTLFRGLLLIPVWIFLYLINYLQWSLILVGWTTVFWRKNYPSWVFKGLSGSFDYYARATAYGLLQTDKFPSFDREASPVRLDFADPPSGRLSRWRLIWWKGVLLIPHMVVLGALYMALFVVTILAWFGILLTGNYPRGMFAFATGVMRWQYRLMAYFVSFNDRYPPYALSANAGPAGRKATVWSGVSGAVLAGGLTTLFILAAAMGGRTKTENVNYADIQQGRGFSMVNIGTVNGDVALGLVRAHDPGDELVQFIRPDTDERVVVFEWQITNLSGRSINVSDATARLEANVRGENRDFEPEFVSVANRAAPAQIASGNQATVQAVFVVPSVAVPAALQFHNGFAGRGGVTYRFE